MTKRKTVVETVVVACWLMLWASPAFPHAGNTNPTDVHAFVGNVSKVVRIVGLTGQCLTSPPPLAETATHWPGVAGTAAVPRFTDRNGKLVGLALDSILPQLTLGMGRLYW